MENWQFFILISTMFLIGSQLAKERSKYWFMIIMASLWMIIYLIV